MIKTHNQRESPTKMHLRIDDSAPKDLDNKIALLKKAIRSGEAKVDFAGTSMEPILKVGYSIMLGSPKNLQPGEILVFRKGNLLACHRLILVSGNRCCMKGDNCLAPDLPVPYDGVIGRISKVYDANGHIIRPDALRLKWLIFHQLYCRAYFFMDKNLPRNPAARLFLRSVNTLIAKFLRRISLKRQDSANQPKK
jgi:hypothetical protein